MSDVTIIPCAATSRQPDQGPLVNCASHRMHADCTLSAPARAQTPGNVDVMHTTWSRAGVMLACSTATAVRGS